MKPQIWPVYVICTISGLLAANGLFRWMMSQGWSIKAQEILTDSVPQEAIPIVLAIAALGMGLGVQKIIIWGWTNTPKYGVFAVAPLLIGLGASFLSALFTAGTFTLASQGDALNFKIRTAATAPFVEAIDSRVNKIEGILSQLKSIGAESDRLADIEANHGGGTCRNDTNPTGGCGRLCRFRKRTADAARNDIKLGEQLSSALTKIALDVHKVPGKEVPRLYAKTVALLKSRNSVELQNSTTTTVDALTNGFFDDESPETRVICESPDLLARYKGLGEAWAQVRRLPQALPQVADAGLGDSVSENLEGLLWTTGFMEKKPAAPYTMLFALFIELFQICLLLGHNRHRRTLGLDDEIFESFWSDTRAVPPEKADRYGGYLDCLCSSTIRTASGEFLVVPEHRDSPTRELIEFFGIEDSLKPMHRRIDLHAIRPDFFDSHDPDADPPRFVSLYRVTRQMKRWRRRMLRDLPGVAEGSATSA